MQSSFGPPVAPVAKTSAPFVDEVYNLLGLNLSMPDQVMPEGETPFTINSRMYAREDGESRVANRTRPGTSFNTAPVGETANIGNSATIINYIEFSPTSILAQPWTPSASGLLTRINIPIQRGTAPQGHIMVEVYTNTGSRPGTLIAASSVLGSSVQAAVTSLPVYFIDCPSIVSGTQYWIVVYTQDNGGGTYKIPTTSATGLIASYDGMATWGPLIQSIQFQTYLSPAQGVKGFTRRYPSTGSKLNVFAAADKVYGTTDTGVLQTIDTGRSTLAPYMRFEQADDKTIYVNGVDNPRWWDGTTASDITGAPTASTHVIIHQNRAWFVNNRVRVDYTDIANYTSIPPVNFFYVPDPKSADNITGLCKFQNNLVIFTGSTKHIVRGSDVSTYQRDEAVGTQGAVSQEAIAVDRNYIYFMGPDGVIYRYNGVQDEVVSDKMQPEFSGINDLTKVRLHLYRNQLRVYYAKTPDVTNNRMAVYDLTYRQWFFDTGRPVTGSMALTLDDNRLIEFSSLVAQPFNGETANSSDLGKPIDYKYWTRYNTYGGRTKNGTTVGGASAKKRIKRFRPLIRTDASDYTLAVGRDFDFKNSPDMRAYVVSGGGAKWGQFVWGDGSKYGRKRIVDTPAGMSGRGNYVQYRFERRGVETPVELYGYISSLKIGSQK